MIASTGLLELFRYMYCDEVNLSGSNVMGVLSLVMKYIVPSLADKCVEYLRDNLDNLFRQTFLAFYSMPRELKIRNCWMTAGK